MQMIYKIENVEVTSNEFVVAFNTGFYLEEHGEGFINLTFSEKKQKHTLRIKRKIILNAFDKWEKAVLRGREDDDSNIMLWYSQMLDLNLEAFDNVPDRIKYYL